MLSTKQRFCRRISFAVLGVLFGLGHGAPARAGFDFDFTMPSYFNNTDPSLFGTGADLTIALDNGNSTNIDQVYTYADIVGIYATAIGGTFSIPTSSVETLTFSGGSLSDVFATTNAQGLIDSMPPTGDSITASINGGQQGIGIFDWTIWWPKWGYEDYEGQVAEGAITGQALTPVPEPGSLCLSLLSLGFLVPVLPFAARSGARHRTTTGPPVAEIVPKTDMGDGPVLAPPG